MRLHPTLLALLAGAGLALAAAPAAHADTLVAPLKGADNLTTGGGYKAWMEPESQLGGDTGWKIQLRLPDGTIATPQVGDFSGPAALDIGSGPFTTSGKTNTTKLYLVYARDGNVYAMDLATQAEHEVKAISSSSYDESAPSIDAGDLTFVRTGGKRDGVYSYDGKHTKRLSSDTPGATSFNGTRVAYRRDNSVVVRKLSDRTALVYKTTSTPRSINLTRYDAYWFQTGGKMYRSARFTQSEGQGPPPIAARRDLSPSTQSFSTGVSDPEYYLDADGIKTISPQLFHG